MKKKTIIKNIIKDETGLNADDLFMRGFDELDEDTDPEDEEFDEDTEDEILEEMLGLNEDYSLEDFLDSWDP